MVLNRFGLSVCLALAFVALPLGLKTQPHGVSIEVAAAEAATVSRINVVGNQRIDEATILSYITVTPGRSFTAGDLNDSHRSLSATGLFSSIRLERSGNVLVVTVVENAIVRQVVFEGNRRIDDSALRTVVQLEPRRVISESAIQSDTQRILESYRRNGRFAARVEPKLIDVGDNRVDLVFEIEEDERTTVSRITFIGNQAFSDGKLRSTISTEQRTLLSFLSASDFYDPDRLDADRELLRRFYLDEGYADFRVVSAVAELDREQNVFFITFTVDEGPRYDFGAIEIDSSLRELDIESLYRVIETRPGQVYDASAVERSVEALTLEVSRFGYAFATVRPRGERNVADGTLDVTYFIDEGVRTYVERINITGNTRTRDYVIRREFDFAEGDPFNRVLVDRGERRLNNLQFFERVRITTAQGSAPDRVVLNVQVVERSTGDFSFGAGYSTSSGFTAEISITERNFLGRGQFVRAAIGGGLDDNRSYEFAFTEPFFLGRRLAAGFDLYRRESGEALDTVYTTVATGGALRLVAPVTNNLTFGVAYTLDSSEFDLEATNANVSAAVEQLVGAPFGRPTVADRARSYNNDRITSSLAWTLTYDTVDNRTVPRDGYFAVLRQAVAGVGGDAEYVRTTLDARAYRTLSSDFDLVGSVRVQAGNVWSWDDDNLLLTDAFYQGPNLVRGFENIGPRDQLTGDQLGGTTYAGISAELNFPFPLIPEPFGLRGAVFADAGTLFGTVGSVDILEQNGLVVVVDDEAIRSSVGASVIWQSPFGPLRADYAFILSDGTGDEEQAFRFSGGTRF
ncbi:MAG: outer membrane protein assembly factor BamA [Pseudomonadota bacterium]